MRPHRRRNYLINRNLQIRYALYIFVTLLIVSLATSACLSFGLWHNILRDFSVSSIRNRLNLASHISDYQSSRIQKPRPDSSPRLRDFEEIELLSVREKELLGESLTDNLGDYLLKAFFLFIIIGIGTVFLTHKIAGPLYRFQKTFEEINKGNVKLRVYLRKGDHAHEVLPELNAMISSIDYSFSKIKALNTRIFEEIAAHNIESDTLTHYRHELESELNRYQTSDAYKI